MNIAKRQFLQVPAELSQLAIVRRFIEQSVVALGIQPEILPGVIQAADEALTNIIVYGYRGLQGTIEIEVWPEATDLLVRLRDRAPLFDPTKVDRPELGLPLELRPLGGLGVFLIRQFMDEMSYRVTPQGGNELTLIKRGVLTDVSKGGTG